MTFSGPQAVTGPYAVAYSIRCGHVLDSRRTWIRPQVRGFTTAVLAVHEFTTAVLAGHGFTTATLGGHGFTTATLGGHGFTSAALGGHGFGPRRPQAKPPDGHELSRLTATKPRVGLSHRHQWD